MTWAIKRAAHAVAAAPLSSISFHANTQWFTLGCRELSGNVLTAKYKILGVEGSTTITVAGTVTNLWGPSNDERLIHSAGDNWTAKDMAAVTGMARFIATTNMTDVILANIVIEHANVSGALFTFGRVSHSASGGWGFESNASSVGLIRHTWLGNTIQITATGYGHSTQRRAYTAAFIGDGTNLDVQIYADGVLANSSAGNPLATYAFDPTYVTNGVDGRRFAVFGRSNFNYSAGAAVAPSGASFGEVRVIRPATNIKSDVAAIAAALGKWPYEWPRILSGV